MGFLNLNRVSDVKVVYHKTALRSYKRHYVFDLHFNGINIRMKLEISRSRDDKGKFFETINLYVIGMGVIGKAIRATDKFVVGTVKYKLRNLERYFLDVLLDTDDEEEDLIEEYSD
jgi:hypothetical protein